MHREIRQVALVTGANRTRASEGAIWSCVQKECMREFPNAKIHIFTRDNLQPNIAQCIDFRDELIDALGHEGGPAALFGYSLGGTVSRAAAECMDHVRVVACIFSPFSLQATLFAEAIGVSYLPLDITSAWVNMWDTFAPWWRLCNPLLSRIVHERHNRHRDFKTICFAGDKDRVVPMPLTSLPGAEIHVLPSCHSGIGDPHIARRIVETTASAIRRI